MTNPAWREIVLEVISERPWKEGKGFGIWIIQSVNADKSVRVQVRAGMYKPNKVTGEKNYPKDGFDISDLKTLKAKWKPEYDVLMNISKGTPVDPRQGGAEQAQESNQPDAMPW